MPNKTLSSFSLRDLWPEAWGASGTLVVCLDQDIVSDTGVEYPKTTGMGGTLKGLGFHWESAITVVSNRALAAAVADLPTTDNAIPAHTARYQVYIYDVRGNLKARINQTPYHLHSNLPDTFTWAEWRNANEFVQFRGSTTFIGDYITVAAMIAAALTRLMPAAQGRVALSGGTATVLSSLVSSTSNIQLTGQDSGISGSLGVLTRTAGVSFVIQSSNGLDEGEVSWLLFDA